MQQFINPHSLFQLIPDDLFNRLLKKWHVDKKVTRLETRQQFKIMAISYILGTKTLREIEMAFGVARSTFGDACQRRTSGFFEDLFRELLFILLHYAKTKEEKAAIKNLLAVDSTQCQLPSLLGRVFGWQSYSEKNKGSAKLHVVWNVEGEWVEDFRVTGAVESDLTIAKTLKLRSGCTYVFDRAYVDMELWLKIERRGSHFVTRLKRSGKQAKLVNKTLESNPYGTGVLFDGEWSPSETACRKAGFPEKMLVYRQIIYKDPETKKVLHFITSDFEREAQEIANIYKKRWSVELLFKWLKGHLQIRRLGCKSKNAVRTWLAVSLCVQILLSLKKLTDGLKDTLWEILRGMKIGPLLETSTLKAFWSAGSPEPPSAGPFDDLNSLKMTGH